MITQDTQPSCTSTCKYQVAGGTLTMTIAETDDASAQQSFTCAFAISFSGGGNTLEIKSTGGTGCPVVDTTVSRDMGGTSMIFCAS